VTNRNRTAQVPPESETVELKQSFGEWKEVVETCAAFASSQGGTIHIGVNPNGEAVGVEVGKGTLEDLTNKIALNTSPRVIPSISTVQTRGKTIIRVLVKESPSKPVWAFDRPFRRSGRTNQKLSQEEAMHLFMDSRNVTWDATVLDGPTVKDVSSAAVRDFLARASAERRWSVSPATPVPKVLNQLGLCKGNRLNVAGLLLFGRNPQQYMTQAMVRCARFKGKNEIHFIDMKVIQGNIVDQVEQAMAFIERNIRMGAEIKGLRREDLWEYPLDALREALVNAICHRDYASSSNVQVRIFDDRLEVWNPGSLPTGMTVDDLRKEHDSKPRNRAIANAFFLIKYVEQFGTGTRRIIENCQARGLPEPEFQVRQGTFIATFRPASSNVRGPSAPQNRVQVTDQVTDQVAVQVTDQVAELLKSIRGTMTRAQLQEALGLKGRANFLRLYLIPALQSGCIEMTVPDKPNSRLQRYRLAAKGIDLLKDPNA
jgi:ATP-dependent DNA helicase RecG